MRNSFEKVGIQPLEIWGVWNLRRIISDIIENSSMYGNMKLRRTNKQHKFPFQSYLSNLSTVIKQYYHLYLYGDNVIYPSLCRMCVQQTSLHLV